MSDFINSLRISGYFAPYRFDILKGILNSVKQVDEEIARGTRARYRSRSEILVQKKQKLGQFTNTWFLKNDVTQILKVPCTPGSKLVNRIKSQCGETRGPDKGRTKFVEMGGTPITWLFPNKDQFGGNLGCQYREKCFISDKHDCRTAKVVYRIECNTCRERDGKMFVYIGTSGFNIHKRTLEHLRAIRTKNAKNALSKHMSIYHQNEDADFVTTCLAGGIRYNLDRFILEALEIEEAKNDNNTQIMNSRSEWGGKGLPRIVVTQ